jgi:ABC-type transporter Mla subunit MlaD
LATRAQKTKVGLFLVICVLLIAGGLLLISGLRYEEKTPYWVEFDESVLGLGNDGLVQYMGVPVGKVSNIYVTPTNKAHCDLQILNKKVVLHEGVKAQLVIYSLATGTMCISLEGGDPSLPPLPSNSEIQSKASLVKSISSQIQGLLDKTNGILDTFRKITVGMEEGDLALLLDDVDGLILRGQEFLDKLNNTVGDLKGDAKAGINEVHELTKEIKKLVQDTDDAVKTVTTKIEKVDVATIGDSANQTMKDISDLSKRLQNTADSVDAVSKRALHEADNVEFNLRESLKTLNGSLEAVRDLVQYLQQDPSALIRGKGKPKGEK